MLTGDRPPLPKASGRNSFHGESTPASLSHHTKAKARRRLTHQSFSTGVSGVPGAAGAGGSLSLLQPQQQHVTGSAHSRHRSISTASAACGGGAGRLATSPESALAKEKEFMANTRILAMSNLIDSFTTNSHTKQGFYGKQLKVIGSASPSDSVSGAELDLTVKIHVIENTWTTCPLLPSSTILHRWKVTHQDTSHPQEFDPPHDDLGSDLAYSKDEKDSSWIQAAAERTETISPAPSPTYEQHSRRPLSTSSISSYSTQSVAPQTHVAVLSNALCFVANRAGDYVVQLSIHVPFVVGTGSRGIHLSHIPKCRSNFIKFNVQHPYAHQDSGEQPDFKNRENHAEQEPREDAFESSNDGYEFSIHPNVMSLDEAHLNPDSDDDAQFWLEVQELLVGRDKFVGKLVAATDDETNPSVESQEDETEAQEYDPEATRRRFEIAGCFAPSSSLHVSWVSRDAVDFVHDVEQDMTIHIAGVLENTKSSTLLQDRKRKDPEDSHAIDHTDQEEDAIEYENLEMDDGDLIMSVENTLTLNVQKLGWKQPFMDFTVDLADAQQGHPNDLSLLEVTGDAIQDWEVIVPEIPEQEVSSRELENLDKESVADQEVHLPPTYRVWFFAGTEGTTVIHVHICVGQVVSVGYGKDISCNIPKIRVHGASADKGRISIHTSNDLVVQRCNTRLVEPSPVNSNAHTEDASSTRHQPLLRFHYQSPDYQVAVIAQRYQALTRIARIERVRAEIGVSGQHQPGFARIVLSNIVLPQQDDPYLRVYQLDGAEVWSVLVDGKPCAKSIQFMDRKTAGQRTVLVPIPEESSDGDNLHQVEISYGFNTVDRGLEEDLDDDEESPMSPTIKLVVPGFSLPVGEYVVVASLPKQSTDVDYDEPTGDFEIMSSLGNPGQRRTITYGAYMTLGRPKLSIRTTKIAASSRGAQGMDAGPSQPSDQPIEALEQIGRTNAHPTLIAHDPQQPPFNTGVVIAQQASQRHPQQPLELQNPHAEQSLDGEILPRASMSGAVGIEGANGAVTSPGQGQNTSNLSPQVGSPAATGIMMSFASQEPFSLKTMSLGQLYYLIRAWWKQIMAPVVALALVIMIINVAAFRETKSTSLDLVSVPAWRRPFAAIGRLWYDSATSHRHQQSWQQPEHHVTYDGEVDSENAEEEEGFMFTETVVTVMAKQAHVHVQETPVTTQDLEIRNGAKHERDGEHVEDDYGHGGQGGSRRSQPAGLMKLIQFLQQFVRDLKQ